MRRIRKISFSELVTENKRLLLNDKDALDKIDEKIEERLSRMQHE